VGIESIILSQHPSKICLPKVTMPPPPRVGALSDDARQSSV